MTKTMIQREIGGWSVFVMLICLLGGCQGSNDGGAASVHLTLALPHSNGASKAAFAPAPSDIGSIHLDVTGLGMDPLSTSVPLNGNREGTLVIEVSPGPARRFVVTAFDTENTPRFRGEATVDLTPGSSPNLTISMVSLDITPGPTIQISPHTAVVPKDGFQRFLVTGANPSQVQFEVTSTAGNDPEKVGSIDAADGDYNPPGTILTDGSTPIGNPIPVTVTAINSAAPTDRDSATVTLTTGSHLTFGQNVPVLPAATAFRTISTKSSGQRNIAYHQGRGYAVWSQFYNARETDFVFFSQSANGTDWFSAISVTGQINQDTSVSESEPVIAAGPDGTVYVALTTNTCPFCSAPSYRVQLLKLSAGAKAFTSLFGPFATNSLNSPSPSLAVSPNGNVFVAWAGQELRGNVDIFLQRLNKDGSLIDAAPQNLTKGIGAFTNTLPVLSIGENGTVYLVWKQGPNGSQLLAMASSDGGNTFSLPAAVNDAPNAPVANPSIAAGPDGTLYVAWDNSCDCSTYNVFFDAGEIQNGTLVFGTDKSIGNATPNAENQNTPSVAWDRSSGIYIGFVETLNGFDENGIFLAKSSDGGETFTSSRIDDGTFVAPDKADPSIAVDSAGRTFAVWTHFDFSSVEIDDLLFAMGE